MGLNVSKYVYRQGTSFARGTTIDGYIEDNENTTLYEKWDKSWPEPLEFHGGIKAITCDMILEVGEPELTRVYGKKLTTKLLEVSRNNAG